MARRSTVTLTPADEAQWDRLIAVMSEINELARADWSNLAGFMDNDFEFEGDMLRVLMDVATIVKAVRRYP